MKKIIAMALVIIAGISMLAGCGAKTADLKDVTTKINSEYSLQLKELSSVDDLNTYYSIDSADVKQFAAEIDETNSAPKEIVLVEAVDSAAADRVEKALTNRYNSIYSTYSSYSPEQLDMVKNCSVTKDGNFISLIVADNAPAIVDYYKSFIK